jgi:tetratricopeptide (TPR) repeat protein
VRLSALTARGLLVALCMFGTACASSQKQADVPVAELRKDAGGSRNPELVGRWLLGELLSPGGSTKEATRARTRLDEIQARGLIPNLARGLDDALHGKLASVSDSYLRVLQAARVSDDPRAPLFAWYAAQQAAGYRHAAPNLWERQRETVEGLLRSPGRIGWRARLALAEWWGAETRSAAVADAERLIAAQHGCVTPIRLAGAFGRNQARDTLREFPPEKPGTWPERWAPEPGMSEAPRVLKTLTRGCNVLADEPMPDGVVYAETFIDVDQPTSLIVSVQGAFAVWVDDALVLRRDLREWGTWLKFGARVDLERGRHRIVAKLGGPVTSIRVLHPDGRPYGKSGSIDAARPYALTPPRRIRSDNPLDAWVSNGNARDPGDDLVRYFGAAMADVDDQSDVASVLLEPLVADTEHATGPALAAAAVFVASDPMFADGQRRDLARELSQRAKKKDPRLWQPLLSLASTESERSGPIEAARDVAALVDQFPEVPAVLSELAGMYRELGWSAEYGKATRELVRRFPEDTNALEQAIALYDEQGDPARADATVKKLLELDPDNEIALSRALARGDYPAALAELKRLGQRRPDRKDITERIYDVMIRAGNQSETWKKLEAAIAKSPRAEEPRLALADARYAAGDRQALITAVVEAVQSNAPTGRLENALDLVEGATELGPYRIDTETAIGEFERSGVDLGGTAARVLDYSAVWAHADGSSRLLEHEIIRVQSAEAIGDMAEQPLRAGVFLKLRVRKKDGRVLEPELVSGKPTVTMPHLEIGDYIETERIESSPGDGRGGASYVGPRWFFREENVSYARSEFVVISPAQKPLQIETKNDVPPPQVTERDGLVVRRWRVDHSPAAAVEPFSAPISEFLPSVQVGWGISLDATLRALADSADDLGPVDPRIRRIAQRIVEPLPPSAGSERARKLYRWITANVEEGQESDGRRVIVGKNGNLWRGYLALCRALGIQADYAVVQNRLTLPPSGPFSSALVYTQPLLRVRGDKGEQWLTLGSKHAPFGYLPAEVRGMPAVVFSEKGPEKAQTPAGGTLDNAAVEGKALLAADGSATLDLVQSFHGKYATGLRTALTQMPERQIRDAIETRLLGSALRGVELKKYEITGVDDPDAPIRISTTSRVRAFAQRIGGTLVLQPPNFGPRLSQFATLPARQTPIVLVESVSQSLRLSIELPAGASVQAAPAPQRIENGERRVEVADSGGGGTLVLDRRITLPAGRVQPGEYAAFLDFVRRADEVLAGSLRVKTN